MIIHRDKKVGKGLLDNLIPMVMDNLEPIKNVVSTGVDVGKTIKALVKTTKDKPDILKMIDEIKGIHLGKGFNKI